MQHENKRWLAGKGFYIILFLCAAAIGISSYVIFAGDREEAPEMVSAEPAAKDEPTLPVTAEKEEPVKSSLKAPKAVKTGGEKEEETAEVSAAPSWLCPVNGSVSRSFSGETLVYSATLGDWRTHNGVDIVCTVGTEVRSMGNGVVTDISDEGLTGMTVTVEHEGGYTAVYANLDSDVPLKNGDNVKTGDVVGKVGKTMVTEVGEQEHLHLEVMKNGKLIDPMSLFDE